MLKDLVEIFHGIAGGRLDVILVAVVIIGMMVHRLATNHMKHIAEDVKDVKSIVTDTRHEVQSLGQRVAHIEGTLDIKSKEEQ